MKKKLERLKISDLLLIIMIIILLIPPVRKEISTFITRITMRPVKSNAISSGIVLSETDKNWEFMDLIGNNYFLKEFEDTVLFLDFWATWCPPCRAEMPSIQNLYNEFGDKIQFVLITNEEPAIINHFMKKNNYNLPVYIANYNPPEIFFSKSIPATFIISKNGEVLLKHIGAAKWDSQNIKDILETQLNN